MFDNILNAANRYATGVQQVQERRDNWLKKSVELKERLTEIAAYLNNNTSYKQGFFVDVLHAVNEDINGTSANMPSITFRSGEMPMLVTFRNSMGEKKSYQEQGFHISFNPTITGQVFVLLVPHHSELDKTPPQYITLALIDDPATFKIDNVDEIITKGIETAFYTSFTSISQNVIENGDATPTPIAHSPIGFKLHETTEKIK